jgi:hypothetical protein
MTLRRVGAVLKRWIWLLIPGLVLGVAAAGYVAYVTPREYTVTSSYLFLAPTKDPTGKITTNPFLQSGGGLPQTVDIVGLALLDQSAADRYEAGRPGLSYTVTRNLSVSAPVMELSVTDSERAVAADVLSQIQKDLVSTLNDLQVKANSPESQLITVTQLTSDPRPTASFTQSIRNGAVVFAAFAFLTFIAMTIAERIRRSVRARRRRRQQPAVDIVDVELPAPVIIAPPRRFQQWKGSAHARAAAVDKTGVEGKTLERSRA